MKLITPQTLRKVYYFAIQLSILEGIKFIAADANGDVYMYAELPEVVNEFWFNYGDSYFVCKVDLEGMDWKDTLMCL